MEASLVRKTFNLPIFGCIQQVLWGGLGHISFEGLGLFRIWEHKAPHLRVAPPTVGPVGDLIEEMKETFMKLELGWTRWFLKYTMAFFWGSGQREVDETWRMRSAEVGVYKIQITYLCWTWIHASFSQTWHTSTNTGQLWNPSTNYHAKLHVVLQRSIGPNSTKLGSIETCLSSNEGIKSYQQIFKSSYSINWLVVSNSRFCLSFQIGWKIKEMF